MIILKGELINATINKLDGNVNLKAIEFANFARNLDFVDIINL